MHNNELFYKHFQFSSIYPPNKQAMHISRKSELHLWGVVEEE